jgi:hypothetical protein
MIEWRYCKDEMPIAHEDYLISVQWSKREKPFTVQSDWIPLHRTWVFCGKSFVYAWSPMPPPAPMLEEER